MTGLALIKIFPHGFDWKHTGPGIDSGMCVIREKVRREELASVAGLPHAGIATPAFFCIITTRCAESIPNAAYRALPRTKRTVLITIFDITEMLADLASETHPDHVSLYRRTQEAAHRLVSDAHAASVSTEVLLPLRMLSWKDGPRAVESLLRYPIDMAEAHGRARLAWLHYLEQQRTLLCEAAVLNPVQR
ncbi:hypothetical protein ACKVEX_09740 [Rhodocyclaceae bacterium SMB388]